MLCTTCHGKGYVTVPYIAGVVSAQYPCPDCHAGCQHCCDGDTMPTPPSYEGEHAASAEEAVSREGS